MTKALIIPSSNASNPSDSTELVLASLSPTRRQRRRFARARRARERRGIILIFVVVLLMLLAIMGTAYLATSRADRMALTKNGALPGATASPRLADRAKLDALFEAFQRRIETAMIEDMFNVAPGSLGGIVRQTESAANGASAKARLAAAFRQEQMAAVDIGGVAGGPPADANRYYKNYDAPGRADPYLSSLLPTLVGGAPAWPWISAPLAGEISPGVQLAPFFADPMTMSRTTPTTNMGFTRRYGEQAPANVAANSPLLGTEVTSRNNVVISSVETTRTNAKAANLVVENSLTTRVYPALNVGGVNYVAGDADGDGIADSGLIPVLINPNANNWVDRIVDQANGVAYFVSYKVVDNSSQINVNTALTAVGDVSFPTNNPNVAVKTRISNGTGANGPDVPNFGFYRSNVGFTELLRNSLTPLADASVITAEINRLTDARFPSVAGGQDAMPTGTDSTLRRVGLMKDPVFTADADLPRVVRYFLGDRNTTDAARPAAAEPWYYRFQSFGDMLEQQLVRRPESVGDIRTAVATLKSGITSLPLSDSVAFASAGGSLLNPRSTPSDTENALLLSTRMMVANYSASTNETWRWFPANEIGTWFGWTKDFTQSGGNAAAPSGTDFQIALLDTNLKTFSFSPANTSGLADINLTRSIRTLITTRSGVTSTTAKRYTADTDKVPPGMPTYGDKVDVDNNIYPAIKVSAATGTKEQLWRAYWSVMTQNYVPAGGSVVVTRVEKNLNVPSVPSAPEFDKTKGTGVLAYDALDKQTFADPYKRNFDAFLPPDRHPDESPPPAGPTGPGQNQAYSKLNENQMALIRSALAACNTIDLRDADNDITAMTVELGESIQRYFGNVLTGDPPEQVFTARNALYSRVYGTEKQLVITGVMIDDDDGDAANTNRPNIIVEIFNPTDEVLDLRGYYLAVANRGDTPTGGETTNTGTIVIDDTGHPGGAGGGPFTVADMKLLAPGATVTTIEPGGFIICTNLGAVTAPAGVTVPTASVPPTTTHVPVRPTPPSSDPNYPVTPSQVIVRPGLAWLDQLQNHNSLQTTKLNRELVLLRTRRADGVASTDNPAVQLQPYGKFSRPAFNEYTVDTPGVEPTDLATLVPIDSVDPRSLNYSPDGTNESRHWYLRNTVAPNLYTPNKYSWKCFYGGVSFDQRPNRLIPSNTLPPDEPAQKKQDATDPNLRAGVDWAWREYPGPVGTTTPILTAVTPLGVYRSPDPALTGPVSATDSTTPSAGPDIVPRPFFAPTIPIQNAKPQTAFDATDPTPYNATLIAARNGNLTGTLVDHPPFQFPYGSPFARNGDLLSVPFIGSYKIYRVNVTGGDPGPKSRLVFPNTPLPGAPPAADFALYEFVALPADAVNVAPASADFTTPINGSAALNPSVGRFDARQTLRPRNDWAADLFDFVTARNEDARDVSSPDVPTVVANAGSTRNDAMLLSTDQDGPVVGYDLPVVPNPMTPALPGLPNFMHPSQRTPWIEWMTDAATPSSRAGTASRSRSPSADLKDSVNGGSLLIPGTININSAPPVVLRMLPWTVDPDSGLLDQSVAPLNLAQRSRVGILEDILERTPTVLSTATVKTGAQHAGRSEAPFGFNSMMDLSDLTQLRFDDPRIPGTATPSPTTNQQLMRMGVLNPQYRTTNESDLNIAHLNMDRVSNLASTRSDLFTVYVTVQAWTWVGDAPGTSTGNVKQFAGSRLVGERRGSFIVDRSRISADRFKPSDLIVYPVDQD